MIPDIAIGAIVAAVIGGMITLAGLIIAKESKVSEFRQAWIDSLRNELASFGSNLGALFDANSVTFTDEKERFDSLKAQTNALNESYYKVAFRLNLSEDSSKKLQHAMVTLMGDPNENDRDAFGVHQGEFITAANELLKNEWTRVKKGERIYKRTVRMAAITISALIIFMAAMISFGLISTKKDEKLRSPASSVSHTVNKLDPTGPAQPNTHRHSVLPTQTTPSIRTQNEIDLPSNKH